MTTKKTTAFGILLIPLFLAGCSGTDDAIKPPSAETDGQSQAPTDEGDPGSLVDGVPLQVGDCWGREDEIELDPIPCDGPHIYEVVGIIEDWDYEQYEGSFEAGIEGDKAVTKACDAQATGYFGYDPVDEGIMMAPNQPKFWGHEDIVVCSAHSGPDVEFVGDEVTGSFADRGWR